MDQDTPVRVLDAHTDCENGAITVITELKSQSPLLRNALPDESGDANFRLLATASSGSKVLKLWKVDKDNNITPYFKIDTSIEEGGILYLVETTDTQFVAANKNTLRMFNFIDKAKKDSEQKV